MPVPAEPPVEKFLLICHVTYQKTLSNYRCAVCETEAGEPYGALLLGTFLLLRPKEKIKGFIILMSFSHAGIS